MDLLLLLAPPPSHRCGSFHRLPLQPSIPSSELSGWKRPLLFTTCIDQRCSLHDTLWCVSQVDKLQSRHSRHTDSGNKNLRGFVSFVKHLHVVVVNVEVSHPPRSNETGQLRQRRGHKAARIKHQSVHTEWQASTIAPIAAAVSSAALLRISLSSDACPRKSERTYRN